MKQLSNITDGLVGQPMFNLLTKAKKMERVGKKIIHFEIGDPNFNVPSSVITAIKDSLNNRETHYTDSMGLRDLRQEICTYTEKEFGYCPSLEQVLIAPANAIIDFVVRCVANPGEDVIIPNPGFPTYYSVLNYTGITPISVPLREQNGFRMFPNDIRNVVNDDTRLIIINSPNNPTGSMMEKKEVSEVATIAEECDTYLLSDEVYSKITYGRKHYSPSVYDQCKERTITLNSFSKIYSMSGLRLGYAIGPESLISKMGLLLETIISCVPPFIQRGGITALTSAQELVINRNNELQLRRDVLIKGLNSLPGVSCLIPDGAFYAFANVMDTGMTGEQISNLLLEKANVAVLDGKYFGKYGEGYIRLSYSSTTIEEIKYAIRQMKVILEEDG